MKFAASSPVLTPFHFVKGAKAPPANRREKGYGDKNGSAIKPRSNQEERGREETDRPNAILFFIFVLVIPKSATNFSAYYRLASNQILAFSENLSNNSTNLPINNSQISQIISQDSKYIWDSSILTNGTFDTGIF